MFTGIIEEIGKIQGIRKGKNSAEVVVHADTVLDDIHLGESIAVNGVCLTVTSFSQSSFTADVMHETLNRSSLGSLRTGSPVNLERAMMAGGRFGGHFVSGHVDGTGVILRKRKFANAVYVDIGISQELSKFCMMKGSVAIDGISLTIFDIKPTQLTVSLIPHTFDQTILGIKKEHDIVNIENDLLGKYVINHLERKEEKSGITLDFLKENGF